MEALRELLQILTFSEGNGFDAFLTGHKSWFRQLCETGSMFVSRREAVIP
jgi:hypothetical protein